ncbi:MAG: DEAD/DEAH box helicase, partial [Chloroflexi bacterium]|nr:DEAD/DEAH box helicase [Chloroflexota bacterium]
MDLSCLTSLVRGLPEFKRLMAMLLVARADGGRLLVSEPARPYVIAALYQALGLPVLVVAAQPEEAKRLFEQIQAWCPSPLPVYFFPETEFLAEESVADDPVVILERLQALSALSQAGSLSDNKPPLVVCSALAAVSKTLPKARFAAASHNLRVGMELAPVQLIKRWQDMGYETENLVEVPGTMSRRGGIVDIFPPSSEQPARIEFSGNQIESIRLFDPQTQLSSTLVTSVTIVPAGEINTWLDTSTILDYLPADSLVITDDLDNMRAIIAKLAGELEEFQQEHGGSGLVGSPILADFEAELKGFERWLTLCSWDAGEAGDSSYASLPLEPVPGYGGRLENFVAGLKGILNENCRVVIISQQAKRLAELLQEVDVLVQPVSSIKRIPSQKSVTLVQGSLAEGWAIRNSLTLFTDKEIFGWVKEKRLLRKRPVRYHRFISGLLPGDYVVHVEHGIARFLGLAKMSAEGVEREYLVLEYALGDKLYVPTDQVDRVSRYVGADDRLPALSRLGTQEWARAKQRVKEAAANMAEELLNLYARREVTAGFGFSADNLWQQELESSFPYVETSDQLDAAQAVKADMEKPRPMDRLVCGDVGYGKTEVALRAAFKATMDGKQVAFLVPTTVLAQQHLLTFRERLQAFPVRVEMLSRFCSEKEQAEIIAGLAVGTIDICIGTHRLLQKDVKFKDLGLVIIDEEQRFGVVHKEHFRRLRQDVDVLTLSATPIPRTLHMSLAGIRDMSTIETPPEERLPIKTHVGVYDDKLVRGAILRELERSGQVFYVHNRVQSIASVANKLRILVPEAKVSVAHGQLDEEKLAE